jgi:hypothetical protein
VSAWQGSVQALKERKAKITVDGKEKKVIRGHIGFVTGQSRDEKYLYVLGGNRGDKVSVVQTLRTAWAAFRMPPGFGYASEALPVYIGDAITTHLGVLVPAGPASLHVPRKICGDTAHCHV